MASVLDAFSEGFRLTSEKYRLFIVPTIALVMVELFGYGLRAAFEETLNFGLLPLAIVIGFLGAASQVWIFSRALTVVTKTTHAFRWSAALALWGYLIIVSLMTQALAFVVGMSIATTVMLFPIAMLLLLLWPALLIYLLVRFVWFVPEIASDEREQHAFERTYELTTGHFWQIVWFMLLSIALTLAGLLALGFGVLFTIPMTVVASIHYYEQLRKESVTTR